MDPKFERELRQAEEFVGSKLEGDPEEFERWANELLDKGHGYYVERRKRR